MVPGTRDFIEVRRGKQKLSFRRKGLIQRKGSENGVKKPQGPTGAVGFGGAPGGRWKKRAGRGAITWFGLRKLHDCSSKWGGLWSGEEVLKEQRVASHCPSG